MSAAGPILIKKRNGKVMIVSPSQELREKVSSSLGPESQPVTEAAGGAEALLKLRESDFCTLMLDPNIEDLHTEELVATIRARYPGLNIVVLEDEKRSRQFSDERTTAVGADSNPPDGPIAALRGAPPVSSRLRAAGTPVAASVELKAVRPDDARHRGAGPLGSAQAHADLTCDRAPRRRRARGPRHRWRRNGS